MRKHLLCLLLAAAPLAAQAQSSVPEQLIAELSRCDARFFQSLKQHQALLAPQTELAANQHIAAFKVDNRRSEEKSYQEFRQPLAAGKLSLAGYFDEIQDLRELGFFYSWGFLVKGSVGEVAETIRPLIEQRERLRKDGETYARTEMRRSGAWQQDDTLASGSVPQPGAVERVFLIEPAEDASAGYVRVDCSLQGSVNREVLNETRPDLAL